MIERELRAGLDFAVATEPPLAFDPDALMAKAERERRRRRSLAGVGVATAVIAAGAVAVPAALHLGTGPAQVSAAGGLTTTQAPPSTPNDPWPPAGVHPRSYSQKQMATTAIGWTREIERVLPRLVPAATSVSVQPWGGEATGSVSPGQNYQDTFVPFTLHGTRTAVYVQVDAPGQRTGTPDSDCAREPGSSCRITWRGASALVEQTTTGYRSGDLRLLTVRQYRVDGSVVSVTAYNYDPTASKNVVLSTTVPLTVAQLTKLATDPVLAF
jgi:hypothetical protein